jgi:hypothetical protein
VTDFRQSQAVLEIWTTDTNALRTSQVGLEVWFQRTPPTSMVGSQVVSEAWTTDASIRFVASQVALEVWLVPQAAIVARSYRLQSQAV